MSGTLRVDGEAGNGKLVATFTDGAELVLMQWDNVHSPATTELVRLDMDGTPKDASSATGILVTITHPVEATS